MWKPKYKDLEIQAIKVNKQHKKNISKGMPKVVSAELLAKKYNKNKFTIYRYLQFANSLCD